MSFKAQFRALLSATVKAPIAVTVEQPGFGTWEHYAIYTCAMIHEIAEEADHRVHEVQMSLLNQGEQDVFGIRNELADCLHDVVENDVIVFTGFFESQAVVASTVCELAVRRTLHLGDNVMLKLPSGAKVVIVSNGAFQDALADRFLHLEASLASLSDATA